MIEVGEILEGELDLGTPANDAVMEAQTTIVETTPPEQWADEWDALEVPNETLSLRFQREDAPALSPEGFTLLCPGCGVPLALTIEQWNAIAPLEHECGWSFPFVYDGIHAGPCPIFALVGALNEKGEIEWAMSN